MKKFTVNIKKGIRAFPKVKKDFLQYEQYTRKHLYGGRIRR